MGCKNWCSNSSPNRTDTANPSHALVHSSKVAIICSGQFPLGNVKVSEWNSLFLLFSIISSSQELSMDGFQKSRNTEASSSLTTTLFARTQCMTE
ncbi:hypothetical protein M514_15684, partial [Trichuris suis]